MAGVEHPVRAQAVAVPLPLVRVGQEFSIAQRQPSVRSRPLSICRVVPTASAPLPFR